MNEKKLVVNEAQLRALEKIGGCDAEYIIGIDEVGLGCWAGPVVVAAVVLPKDWKHPDVKDSKQLSPGKRKKADIIIRKDVLMHCILPGDNLEVDRVGVHKVRERLTVEAAMTCLKHFPKALVVQDGDVPVVLPERVPMVWMAKADVLVPAVSAASILAKVYRDNFMKEQAKLYPHYGFETNVGYGSKKHMEGLQKCGLCPLHRLSYKPLKQFLVSSDRGQPSRP